MNEPYSEKKKYNLNAKYQADDTKKKERCRLKNHRSHSLWVHLFAHRLKINRCFEIGKKVQFNE